MRLYTIRISAVAVVLFMMLLTSYAAKPEYRSPGESQPGKVQENRANARGASSWVFEGCFTMFQTGPCYDVFRDGSGNYWICAKCGQTNNPGPGTCRQLTAYELSHGLWCS
jgi:hypothetical protein